MKFMNDFKYALRLLSKKLGFTVFTTLVMATGLGLSVYLFSFLHTAMFKPLPFTDGASLVQISTSQGGAKNIGMLDLHDYEEIRTNIPGLSEFGAYRNTSLNVSGRDGARRYAAVAAEPNIFELTRTMPMMGRGFTAADNQAGAENVVVIGYDAWQNQFAADPGVIDKMIRVNGESHRVIGVMPEGYLFPATAEMWVPLHEDAARVPRGSAQIYGLAHLTNGNSKQDVNRELALIMQRLEERYPKSNNGMGAYVESIPLTAIQDGAPLIVSMQVIVFLIFVLASFNVGGLLLSRAIERGKETAIRAALGAPRLRLISQMLWESAIICTLGGVIGLVILAWGLEATESVFDRINPERPAFWWDFGIDAYTLGVTALFVLTAILITGVLPAWKNSGGNFNLVLRDGTRGSQGRKSGRLSRILVTGEIFIAMTVLVVVGVMTIANFKTSRADYGADSANVQTAQLLMTGSKYDTAEKRVTFLQTFQSRLSNNAGTGDVMLLSALPGELTLTSDVGVEGREYTKERGYPKANNIVVMPGSLDKLGVELQDGRYFNSGDDGAQKKTAIVTESFVTAHFGDESPLGKRIRIVDPNSDTPDWLTIVGVVEHTIQGMPTDVTGQTPSLFRPFSQAPREQMTVAVRTQADATASVRTLRETLASIDPELPAFRIESYDDLIARLATPMKFATTLFLLFGFAASLLASSGIYGIMSNTIVQKTQEIGVKRALGATDRGIVREYIAKWMKQMLWGGVPGLLAGVGMGFAIQAEMTDLMVTAFALVFAIGAAVILATYLPTRRALRLNPSEALRYE